MYCPPPRKTNSDYWMGLLTRKGHFLWKEDVKTHNCPDVQEFNEEECHLECSKYPECTKYWPPAFYKKGEHEGYLVFPGKQFALDIFQSIKPEEYKAWREGQMRKYALRLDKSDPGGIEIPEEEQEAMENYGKVHYGSTGICSHLWYAEKNWKKEELKKEQWGKEYVDDLLGENKNENVVMQKLVKKTMGDDELIPGKYAKEVYHQFDTVHADNLDAINKTLLIPYQVASTMRDTGERKNLYMNMVAGFTTVYPGLIGKFKDYSEYFKD